MQLASLRPVWPLLTAFASGAMLAGAHAFERFGGLQPCALCLDQRKWHWAVVALSLVALVVLRFKPSFSRLAVLLIGVVLLGSAAMGAYHVAVEQHWVVAQCDARLNANQSLTFDVNAPLVVPRCDEIQWQLWGISMAGYNAIISLLLALASFAVSLAAERKP
jgi:disulfide bond formation protein DsbB